MKYIVTGGLGFIGFHLCRSLLHSDHEVVVIDDMSSGYGPSLASERLQALCRVKPISFKLLDISQMDVKRHPYDAGVEGIFHLAARAGAAESFTNPNQYFNSNVVGTNKIFNLAAELEVPVVYASSSSIYSGGHPYAATKRITEEIAQMWGLLKISNEGFRFYTVYGQYGRPDMSLYRIVHDIIKYNKVRVAKDTFREFTHVTDVVWRLKRSMTEQADKFKSSVDDISSGESVSLFEAAIMIANHLNKKPEIEFFDRESWDPAVTRTNWKLGRNHARFVDNIGPFVDWAAEHVKRNL